MYNIRIHKLAKLVAEADTDCSANPDYLENNFYCAIEAHVQAIAKRNPRCRMPIVSCIEQRDGSYTIVGYYGPDDVFSMYCSKVKGTIE